MGEQGVENLLSRLTRGWVEKGAIATCLGALTVESCLGLIVEPHLCRFLSLGGPWVLCVAVIVVVVDGAGWSGAG